MRAKAQGKQKPLLNKRQSVKWPEEQAGSERYVSVNYQWRQCLPCTWVKSPMLENTWDLHWCLQAIFCISQEKILPEQWDLTEWTCAFVTNSILQISEYTILLIHIIPDKTTKETLRKAADRSLTYGVSLFFLFSDPSTSELNITDLPKQHLGHAGGKKKYKNNNNKPHHTDSVSPSLERGFDLCVPSDSTANTIKKREMTELDATCQEPFKLLKHRSYMRNRV